MAATIKHSGLNKVVHYLTASLFNIIQLIWPPHYYSQFILAHTKAQSVSLIFKEPLQYGQSLWPVCDQINGALLLTMLIDPRLSSAGASCSWPWSLQSCGRHVTLTVHLSTQVYSWVLANLCHLFLTGVGRGPVWWSKGSKCHVPSRRGVEILLATRN